MSALLFLRGGKRSGFHREEEDYFASNTSALVIFCISYCILGQIPAFPRLLFPCVLWGLGDWVKRLSENILIKTFYFFAPLACAGFCCRLTCALEHFPFCLCYMSVMILLIVLFILPLVLRGGLITKILILKIGKSIWPKKKSICVGLRIA